MYIIIVNPISGNGRAGKIYKKLMKEKRYQTMNTVTYFTKGPGHAEELTRKLFTKYKFSEMTGIIVIGGDGTMHEVLNGLQNKKVPVSFIPGGSGNDFARGNNISRNPRIAMENVHQNLKEIPYWLGTYQADDQVARKFVNCIGFGFDSVATASANESKLKKFFNTFKLGTLNYVLAIVKQVFIYKPLHIKIELDGVEKEFKHCFLAIVNNQPYVGGGMKMNPHVKNTDEKLSILIADSVPRWKVLVLLFTIFLGTHTKLKEVRIFQAYTIKVTSKDIMPYQFDGETDSTYACTITKETEPCLIKGVS